MNFSTDRDLLAYEPNVFIEIPFAAQQRIRVTDGILAGTTLTSVTADFVTAQITAGSVVLIGGLTHEVVSRTDANTLEVSLPRNTTADAAISSTDGTGLEVIGRSFGPQSSRVHDELFRLLRIDSDDPLETLDESSVISSSLIVKLESIGTLALSYAGASSVAGDNAGLFRKAEAYRHRFFESCSSANIQIDTDGDGFADERRRFGVVRLDRV